MLFFLFPFISLALLASVLSILLPPLSSFHAHTHMYHDAYIPISTLVVDVSSKYDTTHLLASFISIKSKKLTSKIHPQTELHHIRSKPTFYISYPTLLLRHWQCGWGCQSLGEFSSSFVFSSSSFAGRRISMLDTLFWLLIREYVFIADRDTYG